MINLGDICLRKWQIKDVKALAKNANNKNIWDNLRDEFPYPYTETAAHEWIKIISKENPTTNFAIEYKGKAIGGIGIIIQTDVFRQNAEIGYWLGEKYWNKGISTIALKAMLKYSFTHFPIHRIFAHVFDSNIASKKVLLKCGFIEEARLKNAIIKNNLTQDCLIYSIYK